MIYCIYCNTSQHNTQFDQRHNQFIHITAPHHPLTGHTLKVVRHLRQHNELHFVVEAPNGQTQMIPSRYTETTPTSLLPSQEALLFTPGSLRALVTMVASLAHYQQREDCRHESLSPLHPVEHLQSRDTPTSDCP